MLKKKKSPEGLEKIFIDARMVSAVPHGFARYATRIAQGLEQVRRKQGDLSYAPIFLVNPTVWKEKEFFGFPILTVRSRFLSPGELVEIPRLLKGQGAVLYHSPTFSSLVHCPCPWILTVHDLNHLKYGNFPKKLYYRYMLKPFVRGARDVLTVSQFSQAEIAEWAGIEVSGISIVSNALGSEEMTKPGLEEERRILKKWQVEMGQFFYCQSNPKPHKNVSTLVQAYQTFLRQGGPGRRFPLLLSFHLDHSPHGVRGVGPVTDEEGMVLMRSAAAVFSPSLYEGFGLPPVEAAALGAPVVVSRIPPHQEGLTDLEPGEVIWVEPHDFHGWVNAFHRIVRQEIQGASPLTQEKLKRRFSVERMGQEMDRIYQRVLASLV